MAANDKASKTTETAKEEQDSPILIQMGIFAAILFVSSLLSPLFPASFPVPTPVMGLVILYVLLCTKIVKLRNVAKFGDFMISLIAFLFVPSGIQMAANLDIMRTQGVQIVLVTIIATIVMLICIAYTTAGFMWLSRHVFHRNTEVEE
ncbi:effector of murein hydrolase LrgA [Levilactobacillus namurensis DSM 19117]|uniref:Effector of murein hydrolase LrgA n=2 Tax=Levilactobacillus namurensis TaxID=380393 RepID=A0A0R1JY73_9LACO|nr:CidA/LrgA family protein [Levilactobacillus namurensis]KRK76080.1 effector of murein hydrolase LrgA [Levilactobacillus namurensis DSM 19117]MCW3778630.1 CidA/LrgA family protein [Levilactobacillus namurensis]MDT7015052.1 CidA/LrgA family protein [Levilactobacillus namurensis]MDT7017999.1 CidA/LrgA family protein [Levilactobacillus namurensis]WNN65005.1 CidA/LrgA family protein [Levilactobacillus namurensis]